MPAKDKTREELIEEIKLLERRIAELERLDAERKKADEIMHRSNERARKILESITDSYYRLDRQWRFIELNKNCESVLMKNRKELVGRLIWDFYPKDIYPEIYRQYHMALKDNVDVHFEMYSGPKQRWYEIHACPFEEGLSVYFRDITERKQVQEALRKSGEELKAIFSNVNVGIISVDPRGGKFFNANRKMIEMLGYESEEEIERLKVSDIHPREQLEYIMNEFQKHASGEISISDNLPVKRKDGSIFFAVITSSPLILSGNKYLLAVFRDITKRKQAEEALAKHENRFRVLFESTRDAIMTLEPPSWMFTSANPATVEMFKARNEAEFVSYGPWTLSPERQPDGRESAQKAREMIEIAMRDGSNFFEWTHRRLNGEDFPAAVQLTRMVLAGKDILQATVRDITESKKLEDVARKRMQELEIFYKASIGREERILELKKKLQELQEQRKRGT